MKKVKKIYTRQLEAGSEGNAPYIIYRKRTKLNLILLGVALGDGLAVLLVELLPAAPLELCGKELTIVMVEFLTTNLPQVSFHGFLAVGKILLRFESCLVGGYLRQVFFALEDHRCYRSKSVADVDFLCGE